MKMVLSALLTMSMLAACSNDNSKKGGSKVSPLSTEQQVKFNKTLDSNYILTQSATDIKNQESSNGNSKKLGLLAKVSSPGLNKKAEELKLDMQANCQIDMKMDDNSNNPGNRSYKMTISGSGCPVNTSMSQMQSIDMNSGASKLNAYQKMEVKDASLQQNLDFVTTEATVNILMNENGLSGDLNGYIQTKESGRINLSGQIKTLEMSENGTATQQTYEFQYPDFKVVLTINEKHTEDSSSKTCQLNGQEISEKECTEIMLKLGHETESESEHGYPENDGEIEFP